MELNLISNTKHVVGTNSKEQTKWDDNFVHPRHMLELMDKKSFTILWVKNLHLDLCSSLLSLPVVYYMYILILFIKIKHWFYKILYY